mgnify:CR=1 FL=1
MGLVKALLVLVVIAMAAWSALRNSKIHHVSHPLDRHYAYTRTRWRRADLGAMSSSRAVATGRCAVDGSGTQRKYLAMGRHYFRGDVSVLECSRAQETVTFWFSDEIRTNDKPPVDKATWWDDTKSGASTSGPLVCLTEDMVTVKVAVRIRYRIVDDDNWLPQIQKPGGLRQLVIGDLLTVVRTHMGTRTATIYLQNFATSGRTDLAQEMREDLADKLGARHLELTEFVLGAIEFPKDIVKSFHDIIVARNTSVATTELAAGEAQSNLIKQPTLTEEILALARAERGTHSYWNHFGPPPPPIDPGGPDSPGPIDPGPPGPPPIE